MRRIESASERAPLEAGSSGGNTLTARVAFLWVGLSLSIGFICGCDKDLDKDLDEAVQESETIVIISDISVCILQIHTSTDETPPLNMRALVKWIDSAQPKFRDEELHQGGTPVLKDAWGRELVLVIEDNHLRRIASKGPNGIWDNGKGDDILGSRIPRIRELLPNDEAKE